jgi:hypothetical protein
MGAFGLGLLSGLGGSKKQKNQQNNPGQIAPMQQTAQSSVPADLGTPTGTGIQPGVAVPEHGWQSTVPGQNQSSGQPINTQTPSQGFNGLVPFIGHYIQNHQAKMADTQAQSHIQALQGGNLTPEQQQYHISQLQQLYKGRPEVLQQLGIPNPHAYYVPTISAQTPTATPPPSAATAPPTGGQ